MTQPSILPSELTDEQIAVIQSTAKRLRVSAAAGSGKTRILVERYLRHVLLDGYSPDEMLTITFTRKAAGEMKGRIIDRLREARREEDARLAESGPIQTIHSFCESFLRENALEAGLDPDFEILSESEASRWIDEEILHLFGNLPEDDPHVDRYIRELSGRRTFGFRSSAYEAVKGSIRTALGKLRGANVDRADLRNFYESPETAILHWQAAVAGSLRPELRAEMLDQPPDIPFDERIRVSSKALGLRCPKAFASLSNPEHEQEAAELTVGLVSLTLGVWSGLESRMAREQKLDFTALEAKAVTTLEGSQAVRERVRRRFKVVMVDEAQDVNPAQHRLLDGLGIEYELLVGDSQQSIYAFRQADVAQFRAKAESGTHLLLTQNFRSDPGILNLVDRVFGSWWSDSYVPVNKPRVLDPEVADPPRYPGVELWEQTTKDSDLTATYVQGLIEAGEDPGVIVVLVRSSHFGSEMETALRKAGVESQIVGESDKYYSRLEIRDLANALCCLTDPYDDFALLATMRSPIVGLSLEAISCLAQNKPVFDTLENTALEHVCDAFKRDAFLFWFLSLSENADKLPAWEVLSTIFAKSPLFDNLAKRPRAIQEIANSRKLLALAIAAPTLGPAEFARQIREIRELRHREGEASAGEDQTNQVRIMNIHKAKGLEFDVVVLPQMFDSLSKGLQDIEVDPRLPMVVASFRKGAKIAYRQWLTEGRQDRETEEELRVMYVGATRAKRRLCIVSGPNLSKDSLAKRLARILDWRRTEPEGFDRVVRMRSADDL